MHFQNVSENFARFYCHKGLEFLKCYIFLKSSKKTLKFIVWKIELCACVNTDTSIVYEVIAAPPLVHVWIVYHGLLLLIVNDNLCLRNFDDQLWTAREEAQRRVRWRQLELSVRHFSLDCKAVAVNSRWIERCIPCCCRQASPLIVRSLKCWRMKR